MRVVIPEASLWEPESPFLYRGPIELWQEGKRCDRIMAQHGLATSTLSPRGLRWNGKLLALRGKRVQGLTEDEVKTLRQAEYNLLLAPVEEPETWSLADRFGFLVVGELDASQDDRLARGRNNSPRIRPVSVGSSILEKTATNLPLGRCGIVLTTADAIPPWATFGICDQAQAARLRRVFIAGLLCVRIMP